MAVPAVGVAYSGGRDSTALLHATLAAARDSGVGVVALHVHHGLSANADAWLTHCEARCMRWAAEGHALAFAARRVAGRPRPGESVEAWAREARYAALTAMAVARGLDLVLLGHHRRDQAETVLLQALRGAGPAGLAAMPRAAERGGVTWARPWLDIAPERIARYARAHALDWVEDESNADHRLARNRLRHAVWPALAAAFPDAEGALAGVAARAAEALACAEELAAIDLPALDAGDGGLLVDAWARLAPARRGSALRAWLRRETGGPAPASLVERLRDELAAGDAPASWPAARGRTLRRYRGVLRCATLAETGAPAVAAAAVPATAPAAAVSPRHAGGVGYAALPAAGTCTDSAPPVPIAITAAGDARRAVPDAGLPPCASDTRAHGGRTAGGRAAPRAGERFEGILQVLLAGADVGVATAGAVRLPGWGGVLHWSPATADGIAADTLGRLRIAPRGGGERFQAAVARPPRSLKKQFQALGVPAWRRDVPLAWLGEVPAFVPGLGIDARARAPAGVLHFALAWAPDVAPAAPACERDTVGDGATPPERGAVGPVPARDPATPRQS